MLGFPCGQSCSRWFDSLVPNITLQILLFAANAVALIPIFVIGVALYKVGNRLPQPQSPTGHPILQRFVGVVFNSVGASPTINRLHKVFIFP